MKKSIVLIILLFTGLILTGCSSGVTGGATPTVNSATNGYPVPPVQVVQTAYPVGTTGTIPTVSALAMTQDPNMGSVKGTLLLKGKPVVDVMVYLGNIVTDDKGRELVAGYDRTSLMRGSTDENGNYIVHNVPAGRYGLILDLVTRAYLLDTPDGTQSVILTVKNGEITDVGTLDYTELPGL